MKNKGNLLVLAAIFIFIAIIILYISFLRVTPEDVPQFIQAWVTTQVDGDPLATNEPRTVLKGQKVKLYAVIASKKKDSENITYFTNASQLRLDGKDIPADQIEPWPKKWGIVKVIWSKIEPMLDSFTPATHSQDFKVLFKDNYCDQWPSIWEADAEVDIINEEGPLSPELKKSKESEFEEYQQGLGTMRYTFLAVLYWGENRINPIRKIKSPGIDSADEFGINTAVTRISVREDTTLVGTMRALHNLPYVKYDEPNENRIYRIKNLIGFDSIGAVMAALTIMGYKDLGDYDLEALKKLTTPIYQEVYLSNDSFYYPTESGSRRIKFGPEGIRKGDIILSGTHLGVVTRDIGPDGFSNELFDYADTVLHLYDAQLKEEYISQVFLNNFTILRLKEKIN